jgi:hypothetical protein
LARAARLRPPHLKTTNNNTAKPRIQECSGLSAYSNIRKQFTQEGPGYLG